MAHILSVPMSIACGLCFLRRDGRNESYQKQKLCRLATTGTSSQRPKLSCGCDYGRKRGYRHTHRVCRKKQGRCQLSTDKNYYLTRKLRACRKGRFSMSIDEFTRLKKTKEDLLKYEWSAEGKIAEGLRFFSDNGSRTSEHSLSEEEKGVLLQALGFVERQGSRISYNPFKIIGSNIRQVFVHYCDHKLKKLAKQAKEEAQAVLKALDS